MGMMDKVKAKLNRGKAEDAASQHRDKIDKGMDTAASKADEKTHGKHSKQIDTGSDKAKESLDRLSEQQKDEGKGT
ncbi:antitoxin [Streptomyces sp. NPDC048639]|uniref:antitoxin n=1 Tax=Streptomyces sp. NPDC048639 TaxID=3365581 RepID=UPI0037242E4C